MNATFEKWAEYNGYSLTRVNGMSGDSYLSGNTGNAYEGWKAAIESIEVTPDLVDHAFDSLPSYCQVCPDDIRLILAAVFAKLKESV